MNADITLKGKAYKLVFSDKAGSKRVSTTDGAQMPHTLRIAHQDAIDSATKLPITRSLFESAITHKDTTGTIVAPRPVRAYVVVEKLKGANAPSTADILLAIGTVIQAIASTSADASALDLASSVFVTGEQ